jgi:quercetin dioxygenase-like cupin family protein
MPIIIKPHEMQTEERRAGWKSTTLADEQAIGAASIVARRWSFEPAGKTETLVHGNVEQLLYVIGGSGTAFANGEELALEPESMLWLDPGDEYRLEAGPDGLEILQGFAPEEL